MISGFWHGANWTYVAWGALHGTYLILALVFKNINAGITEKLSLKKFPLIYKIANVAVTFSLVCTAWIFFRAATLQDGVYIIKHMIIGMGNITRVLSQERKELLYLNLNFLNFSIAVALIIVLCVADLAQRKQSIRQILSSKPALIRWSAYITLILSIIFLGNFGSQDFIYFQF
jgi:hypothetical protein